MGPLSVRPVLTLEKVMNPPAVYRDRFPEPTKEQPSPSLLLSILLLDLPMAPTSYGIKPQLLVWHSRPSTILSVSLPSPLPPNATKGIGLQLPSAARLCLLLCPAHALLEKPFPNGQAPARRPTLGSRSTSSMQPPTSCNSRTLTIASLQAQGLIHVCVN